MSTWCLRQVRRKGSMVPWLAGLVLGLLIYVYVSCIHLYLCCYLQRERLLSLGPLGNGWVQSQRRRQHSVKASELFIISDLIKLGSKEALNVGSGMTNVYIEYHLMLADNSHHLQDSLLLALSVPTGKKR